MGAEQAFKALFLRKGIYYKRVHDVSELLRSLASEPGFSEDFRRRIPDFADRMEELTEQRNMAGYGFEEGIGGEHFKEYAPTALEWANEMVIAVEQALKGIPQ